jgi:hypothetical protein
MKARAAHQGLKLKELLTIYIEAGLRHPNVKVSAPGVSARSALPTAITVARFADGTETPALTNRELAALLDDEEVANSRRVRKQRPRTS